MKNNNRIAQSTLEYAVLIILAVAALLVTANLIRARIKANWQESADALGGGRQFEAGRTIIVEGN